jgi:hypothetical protein
MQCVRRSRQAYAKALPLLLGIRLPLSALPLQMGVNRKLCPHRIIVRLGEDGLGAGHEIALHVGVRHLHRTASGKSATERSGSRCDWWPAHFQRHGDIVAADP